MTVEFHSPYDSSFGHTMLTLEDRQMGNSFFSFFRFFLFFFPFFLFSFLFVVYKTDGGGGGGGGGGGKGRRTFKIQTVTDRVPNVVNGYKLFIIFF